MRSLRLILNINWQERITNMEELERTQSTSTEAMVLKRQIPWTGYVIRLHGSRKLTQLPCRKFFQGSPRERFETALKTTSPLRDSSHPSSLPPGGWGGEEGGNWMSKGQAWLA